MDVDSKSRNRMSSDPARNGVRPVYVHGALLALRYTWQRATESVKAAEGKPEILQAWRLLVNHTLDRVIHGLELAMQVLGESDEEEEDGTEADGSNPVTEAADSNAQASAQRVTNLKGGAPTVAKNLKVSFWLVSNCGGFA
jgi:hypothetical protein